MGSEIVINVRPYETRVALLENKSLSEIFIERVNEKRISGNIYRGKVTKVLPGMQVAFVEIGLERSGFLHQSDVSLGEFDLVPGLEAQRALNGDIGFTDLEAIDSDPSFSKPQPLPIEDILEEGQELMVQVVKDPIGTKGARISSYITLPGRYLVFMPMINQIGVSRRIEESAERARLRQIVEELREPGKGYIIRTAAENISREDIKRDVAFLNKMWKDLLTKNELASAASLIHRDLDIVLRSLRDLSHRDVTRIIIDSQEDYERCMEFTNNFLSDPKPTIEYYKESEPIFDAFGIEIEMERAMGRKVWLKSGGYIIIDQTEALTAIDVNTGKYVGKRNQEETILKTNLEAVKEIVYQLKLRNIGGLIIIDFIDMEKDASKEKVHSSLETALRADRSRTNILRVSEFGLVEMTRKRTRENLNRLLCQPCPCCEGKGMIKSPRTICYEVFREIDRSIARNPMVKRIKLLLSDRIADTMLEEEAEYLEQLEEERGLKFTIKVSRDFLDEQFEVNILDFDS